MAIQFNTSIFAWSNFILTQNKKTMKKKRLILISLMMALLPLSNMYVNALPVTLNVGYQDPTLGQTNPQRPPILVPEVSIDDYTLTFDDSCLGCELRLLDENGVLVYSTTISSNTLVLPAYLSGEYEIQIISGIYCFYGYIEL